MRARIALELERAVERAVEWAVESGEATIAKATQGIRTLDEDVGRKKATIASLQAALDETKQTSDEHPTHLEGEVSSLVGLVSLDSSAASDTCYSHVTGDAIQGDPCLVSSLVGLVSLVSLDSIAASDTCYSHVTGDCDSDVMLFKETLC